MSCRQHCLYQFSLALKFPGNNAKDWWILDTDTQWDVIPTEQPWPGRAQGLVPLKQRFFVLNAVPLPFRLVYTHPPWEMPVLNVVVFALLICPEVVCVDTRGFLSVASLRLRFENLKPKCSKSCYIFRVNMTLPIKNLPSYDTVKNPATCTLHMKLFSPHVYKEYMKYKGISCLIFESYPKTVHYVFVKNMKSGKWVPRISDGKYLSCPSVW